MELRPYQVESSNLIRMAFRNGKKRVILCLPTGSGKCLAKNTPILMFDGNIKPVQEVLIGDLLMGPDSTPRLVTSLANGFEMMYRITPVKGIPYVVNESHILSLKRTSIKKNPKYNSHIGGYVVNISVKDYLLKSKTFKHEHKGWRASVSFPPHEEIPFLDPYFLGLWLGDGSSRSASITTGDLEIKEYITEYADRHNCKTRVEYNSQNSENIYIIGHKHTGRGGSIFNNELKKIGVMRNKHIPHRYKTGSETERLQLLAGIIDTDGSYSRGGFCLMLVNERLLDDVVFVAQSLGFSAYKSTVNKKCYNTGKVGVYFSCCIYGEIKAVPCRLDRKKAPIRLQIKSVLMTGIKVDPVGIGEYFGFEIAGNDRLFLLGDFTVTHNTVIFSSIAAQTVAKRKRVLIVTDRIELLAQAGGALSRSGLIPSIINSNTKQIRPSLCHVAMVETLAKRMDKEAFRTALGKVDLVILDEAHKGCHRKIVEAFFESFILGATATPLAAKKEHPLKSYFDDIVEPVDIPTLIESGFLSEAKTYGAREEIIGLKVVRGEYSDDSLMEAFDKKAMYADCIKHWRAVANGKKTLCFNINIEHSKKTCEEFNNEGISAKHLDGETPEHIRKQILSDFAAGKFEVLCNVGVLTAGYDESSIECIIVNRATKSAPLYYQICGRGSRLHPGKDFFTIIDMGSNFNEHGLWNAAVDWKEIFHNPPKKSDKEGVMPVKTCPKCDYVVNISASFCPDCNYVFPIKEKEKDLLRASEFVEVSALLKKNWDDLSISELVRVQEEKKYKQGWIIHQIKKRPKAMQVNLLSELARIKKYKNGWLKHQLSAL